MPQFAYTARTASGQDVTGSITAGSKRETLAALAEKQLFALRVEAVAAGRARWQPRRRIKAQAVATNLLQLADLLQNGVSILKALDILAEQAAQGELAEVLADVRDRVAEGEPLDAAFARHPQVFGELTVSLVRAGSEGAFLEDALKRTAAFLELQEELKWKVVGAMAYPAILAVAGTCVTLILLLFFVPKFAELFKRLEQQGGGLPGPTVALLSLTAGLKQYGLFLAAGLAGAVFALRRALRTEARAAGGRPLEAEDPRGRPDLPQRRGLPLLPRAGDAAPQRRSAAEGPGNQRRIGGKQGARPGHPRVRGEYFLGRHARPPAGPMRAAAPADHGHDQRRRRIEQSRCSSDQRCRRAGPEDGPATGYHGPPGRAALAADHGDRDPVSARGALAADFRYERRCKLRV